MSIAAEGSREMRTETHFGLGSREVSFWPLQEQCQLWWAQERMRGEIGGDNSSNCFKEYNSKD